MAQARKSDEKKPNLWKDYLNRKQVKKFAETIKTVEPPFDTNEYLKEVYSDNFEKLELKDRINRLAFCLKTFLPKSYKKATKVLIKSAPKLPEFENWVLTSYVEQFGLESFEDSIIALKKLTQHGTAEFAIRPFMINHTKEMLKIFEDWVDDPNEHVRRLVAEATRPRGVWVAHIKSFRENPRPVIKLLNQLNADSSLYVRKAVANNLNDISKDHPGLVIETVKRWQKRKSKETDWIIKHGCRTLIKKGNPEILSLLGFTTQPKIELEKFSISKKVRIGDKLNINLKLKSISEQRLVIDYKMHFRKKNGNHTTKVFKWTEKSLKKTEILELKALYAFKDLSTRKHYAGKHKIELLLNGKSIRQEEFLVVS